jgi:3-oxoacyl-[acyl-carrier protein] reductase
MTSPLAGRRALVTGASRGIGAEIVRRLAADGAAVAFTDGASKAEAEKLAAEVAADGATVVAIQADAADPEQVTRSVEETVAKLGGLDILVNNAGLTRDGLAMRMKDEDWQLVLDVNLTAGFRLSRAVLRGMMKRRWGRIIGITSIVGVTGNPGQANYAASKAGMIGMSKALAAEVASRNITVNCVAPGFIATAMTDVLPDEQKGKLTAAVPAGRLGDPKDIAAGVVYLASEQAGYVTGQTLHINGGMAMI